jgi:integrase
MAVHGTGLRTCEVIALRRGHIDRHRAAIRVRKAITRVARGVAEDNKTLAGRRDVKLPGSGNGRANRSKGRDTFLAGDPHFNLSYSAGDVTVELL